MLSRIRFSLRTKSFEILLDGTIETDESYVGGKMKGGKQEGDSEKIPFWGMVQPQRENVVDTNRFVSMFGQCEGRLTFK
jgi:hypothetical protein